MPFFSHQPRIASATNSGPLSDRIFSGLPRHSSSFSSSRITRCAGRLVSTVMERASRLKSSITFSVRMVPSDMKVEMSLYQHPGNHVGVASIGKVSTSDVNNNVFLWTHLYMTEKEAREMTNEMVMKILESKSRDWSLELRQVFEMCKTDPKLIITHGAVYNGKLPSSWFSKNIILIGDAAHPYGPGGQGISMALKDAEALCEIFLSGNISEEKMATFQKKRAEETRKFGESAEARNKPEKQITSRWDIFFRGVVMKSYHLFNGGVLKSF